MKTLNDVTNEMADYVCDNLCKHPVTVLSQDILDGICSECKMEQFMRDILHPSSEKKQVEPIKSTEYSQHFVNRFERRV